MEHRDDLSGISIADEALDVVPEQIARDCCVLPLAVEGDRLHVVHAVDGDIEATAVKLQFILNLHVTFDTAPREAIMAAIDRHYPTGREGLRDEDLPASLPPLELKRDYPLLDLIGHLEFATAGSLSLNLGRKEDSLEYISGKRQYIGPGRVFYVVGWLDVHYRASNGYHLVIRCELPRDYFHLQTIRDLIPQLCDLLSLPHEIGYEFHLRTGSEALMYEHGGYHSTTSCRPAFPED